MHTWIHQLIHTYIYTKSPSCLDYYANLFRAPLHEVLEQCLTTAWLMPGSEVLEQCLTTAWLIPQIWICVAFMCLWEGFFSVTSHSTGSHTPSPSQSPPQCSHWSSRFSCIQWMHTMISPTWKIDRARPHNLPKICLIKRQLSNLTHALNSIRLYIHNITRIWQKTSQ